MTIKVGDLVVRADRVTAADAAERGYTFTLADEVVCRVERISAGCDMADVVVVESPHYHGGSSDVGFSNSVPLAYFKLKEEKTVSVKQISTDNCARSFRTKGETASAISLREVIERLQHLEATVQELEPERADDIFAYISKITANSEQGCAGELLIYLVNTEMLRDMDAFETLHGVPQVKETPAQAKVRELEATIAAARAQIQELKREV